MYVVPRVHYSPNANCYLVSRLGNVRFGGAEETWHWTQDRPYSVDPDDMKQLRLLEFRSLYHEVSTNKFRKTPTGDNQGPLRRPTTRSLAALLKEDRETYDRVSRLESNDVYGEIESESRTGQGLQLESEAWARALDQKKQRNALSDFDENEQTAPKSDSLSDHPLFGQGRPYLQACQHLGVDSHLRMLPNRPSTAGPLFWWQVVGIDHIAVSLLRWGRAFLADQMGLGKTVQTLLGIEQALDEDALLDRPKISRPGLILTPNASIACQWIEETLKWTKKFKVIFEGPGFEKVVGLCTSRITVKVKKLCPGDIAGSDPFTFVISSMDGYNYRHKGEDDMNNLFDWIAVDEASKIRGYKDSKLYQMVMRVNAKWRIGASATPTLNRTDDIKGLLGYQLPDEVQDRQDEMSASNDPFDEGRFHELAPHPEQWSKWVSGASSSKQADAMRVIVDNSHWIIGRSQKSRCAQLGNRSVEAEMPPHHRVNIRVSLKDEEKQEFAARYNSLINKLFVLTEEGGARCDLTVLPKLVSLSFSPMISRLDRFKDQEIHKIYGQNWSFGQFVRHLEKLEATQDTATQTESEEDHEEDASSVSASENDSSLSDGDLADEEVEDDALFDGWSHGVPRMAQYFTIGENRKAMVHIAISRRTIRKWTRFRRGFDASTVSINAPYPVLVGYSGQSAGRHQDACCGPRLSANLAHV